MEPLLTFSGRGRDLVVYPDRVVVRALGPDAGRPITIAEATTLAVTHVALRRWPFGPGRLEIGLADAAPVVVSFRGRPQTVAAALARDLIVRLRAEAGMLAAPRRQASGF